MQFRHLGAVMAGIIAISGTSTMPAAAESSDAERAREIYDAAVKAGEKGDSARAARLFSEADRMAPHPIALKSALRSAMDADIPALAMELVDRAEARDPSAETVELVSQARTKFVPRTGKVRVHCPAERCRALLDGAPIELNAAIWVDTGKHTIEAQAGGDARRQMVQIDPGEVEEISMRPPTLERADPPAPTPSPLDASDPPDQVDDDGLHPAFFLIGLGITAALGAVTIASAIDTKNQHDGFDNTESAAQAGQSAQTRTNVLFVSTLAVGTATVLVGAFAVDWTDGRDAASRPQLGVAHGATFSGRF